MLRVAIILGVAVLAAHSIITKLQVEPAPLAASPAAQRSPASAGQISGPSLGDARSPDAGRLDYPADPAPFDLGASTMLNPSAIAPDTDHVRVPDGTIYHVQAATGSLRAGPSTSYAELATLHRGQELISTGEANGDWLWVRTRAGGLAGYVLSDRLIRAN